MARTATLPVPEPLILQTSKTTLNLTRTKEKLANYGLAGRFFTTLESDILTASGFKTDEELTKELGYVTSQKEAKLMEAGKWGDEVKIRLELAFADKPEVIKEFPPNFQKAKRTETIMLETIPSICNIIDKYSVNLQGRGLPEDHKQKGLDINTQLDALNTQQETLKKGRTEYTQQRIAAYQKLYDTVNEINKIGRIAYADSPADLKAFNSPWPVRTSKKSPAPEVKSPVK